MERYNLKNNIHVFGVKVRSFPNGVGKAFETLVKRFPEGDHRSYYGISQMAKNGKMEYYATAEEVHRGEAEQYKCERYTIEKGKYLTESIQNWREKTECIKDVFHAMIQDGRVDNAIPAIEWYKNEGGMWCMVKDNSADKK